MNFMLQLYRNNIVKCVFRVQLAKILSYAKFTCFINSNIHFELLYLPSSIIYSEDVKNNYMLEIECIMVYLYRVVRFIWVLSSVLKTIYF